MTQPSERQPVRRISWLLAAVVAAGFGAPSQAQTTASVAALPSLNVPAYTGTWYQVAWFPNRFQKQCVSDTAATYRQLPGGQLEVINRCRREDGSQDSVIGVARPAGSVLRGDQLEPAQLEVSFLPAWLRWLPIWGSYWVLELASDGRYAVVSEPTREYLWVLARKPELAAADETAIRSRLLQAGFDLARWQKHPHGQAARAAGRVAPPPATHESQSVAVPLIAVLEGVLDRTAERTCNAPMSAPMSALTSAPMTAALALPPTPDHSPTTAVSPR